MSRGWGERVETELGGIFIRERGMGVGEDKIREGSKMQEVRGVMLVCSEEDI